MLPQFNNTLRQRFSPKAMGAAPSPTTETSTAPPDSPTQKKKKFKIFTEKDPSRGSVNIGGAIKTAGKIFGGIFGESDAAI